MKTPEPAWHCPSCNSALYTLGECNQCTVRSCRLGSIPLLVTEPDRYLGDTIAGLRAFHRDQENKLAGILELSANPAWSWRKESFERLAAALRQHRDLAKQQIEILSAAKDGLGLANEPGDPSTASPYYGMQNLTYPRVDWGTSAEAQLQIETTERILRNQIEKYCEADGEAVMLGAATGRYACDLAPRFAQLTAVELCYTYAFFFELLQRQSLTLFEASRGISDSAATLIASHKLRMPERAVPANLSYIIADARHLPLANESQSTVLSIYFADVMPLDQLLSDVIRVLKPGGRFINFGPVHYHFDAPEWLLTPDEIRRYIRQAGFQFEEDRWLELPWGSSGADGGYTMHRVWSFVLTRIS